MDEVKKKILMERIWSLLDRELHISQDVRRKVQVAVDSKWPVQDEVFKEAVIDLLSDGPHQRMFIISQINQSREMDEVFKILRREILNESFVCESKETKAFIELLSKEADNKKPSDELKDAEERLWGAIDSTRQGSETYRHIVQACLISLHMITNLDRLWEFVEELNGRYFMHPL